MRVPQQRRARALFVAATLALATLATGEHVALNLFIDAKAGSAALINKSGRQRMLVQRITLLSGAALQHRDASAATELAAAIHDYRLAHAQLLGVARTIELDAQASTALRQRYFADGGIDEQSRTFLAAAQRIADGTRVQSAPSRATEAARRADLLMLRRMARGGLAQMLDQVVELRQHESENNVRTLRWLHWLSLVAVLSILLALSRFVILPILRQVEQSFVRLTQLAERDHLTQLYNRYAFQRLVAREVSRARRYQRPVSLCMIDVDHFKAINDQHGHDMGDRVLTAIARLLESVVRDDDLVARIGGEEFAILMPDTTLDRAVFAMERIRARIAAAAADAMPLPVTISAGVAPVDAESDRVLENAMRHADTMLYRAKNAGRNRVWPPVSLRVAAA